MAKNSFTQYFAKRSDERLQKFLKLHEPETLEKISMPKPVVSTKMVDRRTEHGYNPGDDEKAYDPQESKNEEVEINELSKKTLGSYIKKASDSLSTNAEDRGYYSRSAGETEKQKENDKKNYRSARFTVRKREKGISKAADKLAK